MSQLSSDGHESDPLLAFFQETAASEPAASVEPVEVSVQPLVPAAPAPVESDGELRQRIERAERQIERALIEIVAAKGDLATLVNAVDDIKRRMSRPPAFAEGSSLRQDSGEAASKPAPVAAPPSRKAPWRRAMAAIVILLTAGAVFWGLTRLTTYELPEPPAVENETSSVVASPVVVEPPPGPQVVSASATSFGEAGSEGTPPPPARAAPTRQPAVAKGARLRQDGGGQAGEAGSPRVYVGTLTVDAEPAGDVYLNRKNVGRTPVRLDNLRAGSHLIWIEREGHRRWTRVVAVAADRVSRVSASLDPLTR